MLQLETQSLTPLHECRTWYKGVVDGYKPETGQHHITYDDGEKIWGDLRQGKMKWLGMHAGEACCLQLHALVARAHTHTHALHTHTLALACLYAV